MKKKLNPGSDEAIKAGCKCPVLDNNHGRGCGAKDENGDPLFWMNGACKIHGGKDGKT
jgi:hypothetical protein